MPKHFYGLAAISGLVLMSGLTGMRQATAQISPAQQQPMDADDGTDDGVEPLTLDSTGAPLPKATVEQRKTIATCMLALFPSIPKDELTDYAETVGFYLPHKVTEYEAIKINQRIAVAFAETARPANVESLILKPTRVSKALQICLAPKSTV